MFRKALLPIPLAAALLALAACGSDDNSSTTASAPSGPAAAVSAQDALPTATPIKHLVVIFGENRSFDNYFATYPQASNPAGEPMFTAAANTPTVNNLSNNNLIATNPNQTNASNLAITPAIPSTELVPFRFDRAQANTADQSHSYSPEQKATDNGLMDAFPAFTGSGTSGGAGAFGTKAQVLGFFDGNTVTAMWNYAQHFAMSQNAYTDTYGPSTPGAIAVVSGQNNGAVPVVGNASTVADGAGGLSLTGDTDPANDTCSSKTSTVQMTSKNIGDLLNAKGITWGGFMGGFNLTTVNVNGTTGCSRSTFSSVLGSNVTDYTPHHMWFQYYTSTANPTHARPSSTAAIGSTLEADGKTVDPANHNYDTDDFFAAVSAGNFPSVSYLKAPAIGDAHPGNSDPLDEQAFVTKVVNFLMQQPDWKSTAVVITYDDSDGWYDHRYQPPLTSSFSASDSVNGTSTCNVAGTSKPAVGVSGQTVNGRCGPGTRIPFIVISPYAKANFVDDTQINQSSVVKFIEDNWLGGQRIGQGSNDATDGSIMSMFDFTQNVTTPRTLFLDGNSGTPTAAPTAASAAATTASM
ncbi:MAG TPA: alkaline phosphatase family protein [Paraburkholderia sp.]|nr:alkaline phosphatase family protein [Paraburkholderia sp.]